jgi:predicted ATPase with chaperone activity
LLENKSLKELLIEPESISSLGIPENLLIDIVLRLFYNEGNLGIRRIIQVVRVPLVVEKVLNRLLEEKAIEVQRVDAGVGLLGYVYRLTDAGESRAREATERSQYVGPAPVPVNVYNKVIELQTEENRGVDAGLVQEALQDMVLPKDFHRQIGPAINTAASFFLYGPSGNGKTTIAKKISKLIAGTEPIWLPYAITAGGQIIQVYDRLVHEKVEVEKHHIEKFGDVDTRWGLFKRPAVAVGGELKMDAVDLRFDPVTKIYEAPLQLKANGGMFLIDDFGRQQISPTDLLNRWIVPLEEHVDYLRLRTGQTIVVPFRQLIIFSTNLEPYELAEDAFYRRIQMKVKVNGPDEDSYKKIFETSCEQMEISYDEGTVDYLLEAWYKEPGRGMQAVHPRDLLIIVRALCHYEGLDYQLNKNLIDTACLSYFVD